jgi:serine/threonine protein kinase
MRFTYGPNDRPLDGYTIQQGLGRGGFGEVYQAVSDGGKQVALKLVQRNLEVELRGVSQCLNLKHANLVSVYDVKQAANGDSWVVMEFVQGDTLDQVIARHPQGLPPAEALAWLRGICAGVGYLHAQGIVHRDLKPGNTFVESDVVKIGDYGLSKFISTSRRSGQTTSIGTVHYMAPEVLNGRYGKEVDLYAIGVIMYEMLAGRVPFNGQTPAEILMKHLTETPDLTPLPPAFRPVVARLLDKDPYRRYSSVPALVADLDGYLARAPEEMVDEAAMPQPNPAMASQPSSGWPRELGALLALHTDSGAAQPVASPSQERSLEAARKPPGMGFVNFFLALSWFFLGVGMVVWISDPPGSQTVAESSSFTPAKLSRTLLCMGGVLLVPAFFLWARKRKLANLEARKLHEADELARRANRPPAGGQPQRQDAVLAVLAKLTMSLAIGAGVGLCVAVGSEYIPGPNPIGNWVFGGGVGLIVFGGTAYGWLFGEQQASEKVRPDVPASQRETPISAKELPQETGPWQPPPEHEQSMNALDANGVPEPKPVAPSKGGK